MKNIIYLDDTRDNYDVEHVSHSIRKKYGPGWR